MDFSLFIKERAAITFSWFGPSIGILHGAYIGQKRSKRGHFWSKFFSCLNLCFFLALLYTNHTFQVVEEPPAWEAGLPTRGGPRSRFIPLICEVFPQKGGARHPPPGIPPHPQHPRYFIAGGGARAPKRTPIPPTLVRCPTI